MLRDAVIHDAECHYVKCYTDCRNADYGYSECYAAQNCSLLKPFSSSYR